MRSQTERSRARDAPEGHEGRRSSRIYHVALEHKAVLVSADAKYFRKAQRLGSLIPLAIWKGSGAAENH